MKLLYFFIALISLTFGGYMIMNNYSFDHTSFSNYLINAILMLLICSLAVTGAVAMLLSRRKHYNKDMMTIRQYYDYKSVR
jgi:uncharacterized membrane protein YhaH (DUF805 family)